MDTKSTIDVIKPPALAPGDTVAIVAPASNLKEDYLKRGAAELERLGFHATYRSDILAKTRYTAGDDERRARELIEALDDPSIKAVWAARGGYGTMRLIPFLEKQERPFPPKIFIGYSDMTALHLYFYRRFGWVTFHGPMAAKDLAGGESHYHRETLIKALTQPAPMGEIRSDQMEILHGGPEGSVSGRLLGGCLSLIVSLLGTPYELDTRNAILFLEDTGTKPFALDRMLQHLKLAGKFAGIRGLVFGEMTDCIQHAEQGYRLQEVLAECTADLGVPVFFGLPSGHSPRGNLTLPLGVMATMAKGVLRIDEGAVC